jgi:outer membrane lipoprotein SlyB
MKHNLILLFVIITTGLAGCASNLSGDTYSRSEARTAQQVARQTFPVTPIAGPRPARPSRSNTEKLSLCVLSR